MGKLDSVGVYRGKVLESSLGITKKSGLPQWVARLSALEKYVEEKSEIEHFEMDGPGWVDWSDFGEDIMAFLVLFKSSEQFDEETSLLNYEQLQIATGWDGTEFDSLNDDSFVDKTIQFRVEENEYDGKVSLQVNWVDEAEANPARELKKLDTDKLKDLNSKLKISKKSKPSKPSSAKPAAKPKAAPAKDEKKAPPKAKAKEEPKTEEPEETQEEIEETVDEGSNDRPTECSQVEAWEYVVENKGDNDDSAVEEAWIAACGEIGKDKDEDDFTDGDWAKVRNIVIKDLGLDA